MTISSIEQSRYRQIDSIVLSETAWLCANLATVEELRMFNKSMRFRFLFFNVTFNGSYDNMITPHFLLFIVQSLYHKILIFQMFILFLLLFRVIMKL